MILLMTLPLTASAKTVTVSAGGNIQTAITGASAGDTVSIMTGTFTISSPISMNNGVNVQGAGVGQTIIKSSSPTVLANSGMILFSGVSGTTLSGLTLDGGCGGTPTAANNPLYGKDSAPVGILVSGASSQDVFHDLFFKNNPGDGIRTGTGTSHNTVYNCQFDLACHDQIQLNHAANWHIYNCFMNMICNSNMRLYVSSAEVDHCTFTCTTGSGFCGVELQGDITGSNIHNNVFERIKSTHGQGICDIYPAGDPKPTGTMIIKDNIFYSNNGVDISLTAGDIKATISGSLDKTSLDLAGWQAQGYGYGGATNGGSVYNGTPALTLSAPDNDAQLTLQSGTGMFYWASNLNSTNYEYEVSASNTFASMISDKTTSAVSAGVDLSSYVGATLFWRARAYNDVSATWCAWTNANSFVVANNTQTTATAMFSGVVKDAATGNPVEGAVCTLSNSTSTVGSIVTSVTGEYAFTVTFNGTSYPYYMQVQAAGYEAPNGGRDFTFDGNIPETTQDIYLVQTPSYFPPHMVSFIIEAPFGYEKYSGVYAEIWDMGVGGAENGGRTPDTTGKPDLTGFTDSDGQVVFALTQDHEYYVLFTDDSQNINYAETITPSGDSYPIWVWNARKETATDVTVTTNAQPVEVPESDVVSYGHHFEKFNLTEDYFNASVSTVNGIPVSAYTISIVQTDGTNENNPLQGGFSNSTTGSGDTIVSMLVPCNASYSIVMQITHPSLSYTISKSYNEVATPNGIIDWADLSSIGVSDYNIYTAIAVIVIVIIALLTGRRSAKIGAMGMFAMYAFFIYIGYLQPGLGDELIAVGAFLYLLFDILFHGSVS